MPKQARSSQGSNKVQNGYSGRFRKHASHTGSVEETHSPGSALRETQDVCVRCRQASSDRSLLFRLPDVGFYFFFFFFLTIVDLLYDQTGGPALYTLHIGSGLVLAQVPPAILISVGRGHVVSLGFQVHREAVHVYLSEALVTQSVAPGSLLDHLPCEVSHVTFAFPADEFACLVNLQRFKRE